jgi:hypothetical protein
VVGARDYKVGDGGPPSPAIWNRNHPIGDRKLVQFDLGPGYSLGANKIGCESFVGQYAGSQKEPDWQLRRRGEPFSSIIVETGWSESMASLKRSQRLWQTGSGGHVRVVFIVNFHKPNAAGTRVTLWVWKVVPGGQPTQQEVV